MNTSWEEATFDLSELPSGSWTQVSDGNRFREDGCECGNTLNIQSAEWTGQVTVPARSAPVWIREDW